jgi:hypothetical protein
VSIPVDLAALDASLAEFGPAGFLVTVNPDGRPHVVSVSVSSVDGHLTMAVGGKTRANVAGSPAVTLLWPGAGDYGLIVDGIARQPEDDAESLEVQPTTAVLHRLSTASRELPSCVALDQPPRTPVDARQR